FYTGLGLLTPAGRTGGNFRLYDEAAVARIAAIRRLESSGVSLDDIAQALRSTPVEQDVATLLRQFRQDLDDLCSASRTAEPDAKGLLAAITARAHELIATALQIAGEAPAKRRPPASEPGPAANATPAAQSEPMKWVDEASDR
ncbi:MAG: MerR family transcriptional regulator, partial [Dactylosporangium sp.]|nr:MerR family transcriptional regulator [Dactylosporangium sp.]